MGRWLLLIRIFSIKMEKKDPFVKGNEAQRIIDTSYQNESQNGQVIGWLMVMLVLCQDQLLYKMQRTGFATHILIPTRDGCLLLMQEYGHIKI